MVFNLQFAVQAFKPDKKSGAFPVGFYVNFGFMPGCYAVANRQPQAASLSFVVKGVCRLLMHFFVYQFFPVNNSWRFFKPTVLNHYFSPVIGIACHFSHHAGVVYRQVAPEA